MDEEFEKDDLLEDDEYIDFLIDSVETDSDYQDECSDDDELNILNEMGF